MKHTLLFTLPPSQQTLSLSPTRLINAGYSGRDQATVQEHVDDMRRRGIPAPTHTPCFFPKASSRIQQQGALEPLDEDCLSEAEFVLITTESGVYVTVGCDVFDFRAEGFQADKSKWLYPNYLATEIWPLDDVKGHWDSLVLRSWLGKNRARLYQQDTLAALMTAPQLLAQLADLLDGGVTPGTVLFSGTVHCLIDGMPYADYFEAELFDPVLNRRITCQYELQKISWYRGK